MRRARSSSHGSDSGVCSRGRALRPDDEGTVPDERDWPVVWTSHASNTVLYCTNPFIERDQALLFAEAVTPEKAPGVMALLYRRLAYVGPVLLHSDLYNDCQMVVGLDGTRRVESITQVYGQIKHTETLTQKE